MPGPGVLAAVMEYHACARISYRIRSTYIKWCQEPARDRGGRGPSMEDIQLDLGELRLAAGVGVSVGGWWSV